MATHGKPSTCGSARNAKSQEYTVHHFVYFLDCCKALLDNNMQGELPLMKESFSFKYPSTITKTSGGFASWSVEHHQASESKSTNQVPVKNEERRKPKALWTSGLVEQNPQTGQRCSGSRRHKTEQYVGSGAFRTNARKYISQPSELLSLEKRIEQGAGLEGASQVDEIEQKNNVSRLEFKDSPLASESFYGGILDDDEFSLQHWMSIGCIQNDTSEKGHWDHNLIMDGRRLGTRENLTRERRNASPSRGVLQLTNIASRKPLQKKQHLTPCKQNKESRQNLSLSRMNSDNDGYIARGHHAHPFTHEGLVFVQQGHTIEGSTSELHKRNAHLHDLCQKPGVFPKEFFRRSGKGKEICMFQNIPTSLSSSSQRTLSQGCLEGVKQSPLAGESELTGNQCIEPCQRSTRNNQRKTCPDSSRSRFMDTLSGSSSKKYRPSTRGPQRDSISEGRWKAHKVKERSAECSQIKDLTSRKQNQSSCVEASRKHANVCTGESAIADILVTETGLRHIQLGVQEENGCTKTSQEGDKIAGSVSVETTRSLSQKYRPKVLNDLIGQNFVARALSNAILNDKVAPVYLFQGPPGTGKTSAARIFAAALNCLSSGEKKPCGLCTECIAFVSGKTSGFWELDAASHNGIVFMKELIQSIVSSTTGPQYNVIILDECHMFSHETWFTLLKFLEEPPENAVIILITTVPDKLPLTVVSRCQKFHFLRIKHLDIVNRLDTVMKLEKLDAEPGVLSLIASRSEGSLRDAEILLDQVSLLEQRITLDTIHQLVGSVPDEKLLSLLDVALHSDTLGTIQRARDLVDSGVEPSDLIFQLATLITNILAGTYIPMNTNQDMGCLFMHALSDAEMERWRAALKILSEAYKQLKATSQYRTTWLTAALLHVGRSLQSKPQASRQASQFNIKSVKAGKKKVLELNRRGTEGTVSTGQASEGNSYGFDTVETNKSMRMGLELFPSFNDGIDLHVKSPSMLERLWLKVLKFCRPLALRQQLRDHGKLLAVSFSAAKVVAHLKIEKQDPELTAEFNKMCIVNSFEKVLGLPVEVEMSLPLALCSAGTTCSSEAFCNKSAISSTSKLCAGCEGEILDVQSNQSSEAESEISCTLKSAMAAPITNLIQPKPQDRSPSNLLVLKQHFNGTETAVTEQQGWKDRNGTQAYKSHKFKNLSHEHPLRCGGLLCWRLQQSETGEREDLHIDQLSI